ncbi:MAG TPA: flavodoxin family protein [Candidatus Omnitrophota bacterium]|nr:flavodoxin family protein [Candidatus Omnitrophota bacterium]HPT06684.1 flavodoxin family protein [Candidatus Omnitrophota bacterium]
MKIIALNGSPRKEWNTATLLKKALEGASSQGAATELIHLYDLDYKGCVSCFACKERGGKSYGACVIKDVLKPIFKDIEECDAIIFGSPIYLGSITGQMQSFLERLVFPYLTYTDPPQSLFPRKIPTGFIYTMGVTEKQMDEFGYGVRFANTERFLARIFGSSQKLLCFDTYQFDDYFRFVAPRFNPVEKLKRREEVFPQDCQKAFEMGVRFTKE